jgi:hypothetical protein
LLRIKNEYCGVGEQPVGEDLTNHAINKKEVGGNPSGKEHHPF